MTIELRPIIEDEFRAFNRAAGIGFGHHARDEDSDLQRHAFEFDRSLAAVEDGKFVGTGAIMSFQLTVPTCRAVPAAGVSWITVSPTHRRRGILTAMMRRQFHDLRERGEPLAILYASESSIYGRFGYGIATMNVDYEIDTRHGGFNRAPEIPGQVRLLDKEEAKTVIPEAYERFRLSLPGALSRDEKGWEYWFQDPERWHEGRSARFYAAYQGPDGEIEGYAPYRIRGRWENGFPNSTLSLMTLIASNPVARAALWRFAMDVDLIGKVEAQGFPNDEPVRWMFAEPRRLRATSLHDALWLRLVDIPASLEGRRYAIEDHVVFHVTDPFLPENDGCYELHASPDGAICRRSDATPDLSLAINELSAVYLGGIRFTSLGAAALIQEHTQGALFRCDRMFASETPPWCTFGF